MNYYYCADGSNVVGPCTLEDLARLWSGGTLAATTQVCPVGMQTWQPIAVVLPPPATSATPPPPPPFQPPQRPPPLPDEGDATGGIIPYKNPHALTAYYLGLFGLIPFLGLFLSIPAFFLGISGLKQRRRHPHIKGAVHAWIGIILGGLFSVLWLGAITLICVNAFVLKH